jgi:hypothetical protein
MATGLRASPPLHGFTFEGEAVYGDDRFETPRRMLESETSSAATTVVPGLHPGRIGSPSRGDSRDNVDQSQNLQKANEWLQRIDQAFMEADDTVTLYKGLRVSRDRARDIKASAAAVTKVFRDGFSHCDPDVQAKIVQYRGDIGEVLIAIEEMNLDAESSSASRKRHSPDDEDTSQSLHMCDINDQRRNDIPATQTAVEFEKRNVIFLLGLISDDELPDVEPGVEVETEKLKELHDVKVPQVHGIIKDLRDAARKYSTCQECDQRLIHRAQLQCERAFEWTCQVVARFRAEQHHLAGNIPAREITFSQFNPAGDMSIYEFCMLYEEWAHGYISADAKAHLLFSKYLPKSLTEGYEELKSRKNDYGAMKSWLIEQYGAIRRVADNYLRVIRALKHPKSEDDLQGNIQHLRGIHQRINSLYNLEIRKGVLVPGLREHVESNTFLTQLAEVLPRKVQKEWSLFLAEEGVTVWRIEGQPYFYKILQLLKRRYMAYEILATFTSNEPPRSRAKAGHVTQRDSSPTGSLLSTDGVAAARIAPSQGQKKQPGASPNNGGNYGGSLGKLSRWCCPMEGHENHELGSCHKFFQMRTNQRREACKWKVCWTCLSRQDSQGNCWKGECARLAEIPTILVCQDCAINNQGAKPPLNVLMCSLASHDKPSEVDIRDALEKWIPGFRASQLQGPIAVSLSTKHALAVGKPPMSRSSQPSKKDQTVAYNTRTGGMRTITQKDTVILPSKEEAFFVMQQLSIGGEDVLTFYDSGANIHLVEGELAERVGFTVLNDRCVSIGVVGGGQVWSEYGQYSCVLGPDTDRKLHLVELQGLARISAYVPEFDLTPLQSEASSTFRDGNRLWYPKSIGGDRVKLLLGIRSTSLAPKLHASLPNGLGIYISALVDIYGSNICYGGTHEIFTKGYAKAGLSASHLQVLLTQTATAYMRAPYTMVATRCEDNSPGVRKALPYLTEDDMEENLGEGFEEQGVSVLVPNSTPECHCANTRLCDTTVCYEATASKDACFGNHKNRPKVLSLQEVIENSVIVDLEAKKVLVDLPCIEKPGDFLTYHHKTSHNLKRAKNVDKSECIKPEQVKEQIRNIQKEHGEGPLGPILLPYRRRAEDNCVKDNNPVWAVDKPGRVSTPVCLVVGPSMKCLNIYLAKEENVLVQNPDAKFGLYPSTACMDLQKKTCIQKATPDSDVLSAQRLCSVMKNAVITQAGTLSRISEFFSPTGWWESFQLQLKHAFQEIDSLDWKVPFPEELHEAWVGLFIILEWASIFLFLSTSSLHLPALQTPPRGQVGLLSFRGVRPLDGSHTCNPLYAKS